VRWYRRDRTEGQPWAVYLGVEKQALASALESWFDPLGVPVVVLRGYSSQTYVDTVADDVAEALGGDDGRRSVLIYAGDLDPSGEDIRRDFLARTRDAFDEVEVVALTWELVESENLPPMLGKATDSRAADFAARHGRLVQVELEALPLPTLRALYEEAIGRYFDMSVYESVREVERRDIERLRALRWRDRAKRRA
jgi:hypothetical protein